MIQGFLTIVLSPNSEILIKFGHVCFCFFLKKLELFPSCERFGPKCSFQFSTWFPRCERRRAPPYFCSSPCLEHLRPPSPPLPRGACGFAFSGWESWDLLGCCDLSSCWVDDKCVGLLLLQKNNLIYVLTFLEKFIVVCFKKIEISPTYLLQHSPNQDLFFVATLDLGCQSWTHVWQFFLQKTTLILGLPLPWPKASSKHCDFFTWNARGKERVDVQTFGDMQLRIWLVWTD